MHLVGMNGRFYGQGLLCNWPDSHAPSCKLSNSYKNFKVFFIWSTESSVNLITLVLGDGYTGFPVKIAKNLE